MPSKNKKYYQKLISDHKKILRKTRELVATMLDKLEEDIQAFEDSNSQQLNESEEQSLKVSQKFWWGEKESCSSVLNRLTQLLLKLIPLEQEIAKIDLTKADLTELEEISEKFQYTRQRATEYIENAGIFLKIRSFSKFKNY